MIVNKEMTMTKVLKCSDKRGKSIGNKNKFVCNFSSLHSIKMLSILLIGLIVYMMSSQIALAEESTNVAEADPVLYKGEIIEIVSEEDANIETSGGVYEQKIQTVKVKLLNKDKKGEIIEIVNYIDEIMAYTIDVKVGDDVYVFYEKDENGKDSVPHIHEFRRDKNIVILLILFIAITILVGGSQGVKSLITLGLTVLGVYYLLIGIVNGGEPISLSIIISFVVTIMTMFLVAGFNIKAISAIGGTFGGVLIAGVIAIIVSKSSNLSGLGNQEAQMLLYSQSSVVFNIHGILFASILLGTLGAVMDVCMSIASSINEITEANPYLSRMDLFKSGMTIGKDVMGTMINTLILAYIGSSVFLILIFMVNDIPLINIINMDIVATEIVRALSGTIGLIGAIPLTAFISTTLEKRKTSY